MQKLNLVLPTSLRAFGQNKQEIPQGACLKEVPFNRICNENIYVKKLMEGILLYISLHQKKPKLKPPQNN
jgi:hypothetical protein